MNTLDDFELGRTWKRYWAARSAETEDSRRWKGRLVAHYYAALSSIIRGAIDFVPTYISRDDVTQEVLIAIGRAVDRFDPARGFQFESFAADLVRASVRDFLRREDWVPRSIRQRQRSLRAAYEHLERTQPDPTDHQRAEALGMSLDEFYDFQRAATAYEVCSLDTLALVDDEAREKDGYESAMEVADLVATDTLPYERLESADRLQVIRQLVNKLPERLRGVVEMRYYRRMTLQAIANVMGVSQSRIAQLERDAFGIIRRSVLAIRQEGLFTDQEVR